MRHTGRSRCAASLSLLLLVAARANDLPFRPDVDEPQHPSHGHDLATATRVSIYGDADGVGFADDYESLALLMYWNTPIVDVTTDVAFLAELEARGGFLGMARRIKIASPHHRSE